MKTNMRRWAYKLDISVKSLLPRPILKNVENSQLFKREELKNTQIDEKSQMMRTMKVEKNRHLVNLIQILWNDVKITYDV